MACDFFMRRPPRRDLTKMHSCCSCTHLRHGGAPSESPLRMLACAYSSAFKPGSLISLQVASRLPRAASKAGPRRPLFLANSRVGRHCAAIGAGLSTRALNEADPALDSEWAQHAYPVNAEDNLIQSDHPLGQLLLRTRKRSDDCHRLLPRVMCFAYGSGDPPIELMRQMKLTRLSATAMGNDEQPRRHQPQTGIGKCAIWEIR